MGKIYEYGDPLRERAFDKTVFSPSEEYCNTNYDQGLVNNHYTNISKDSLFIYLNSDACDHVTYQLSGNYSERFAEFSEYCMFYLPHGGNVEKAVNCMNYYVYVVDAKDFISPKIGGGDHNFNSFYYEQCKQNPELDKSIPKLIDYYNYTKPVF